MGSPFTSFLVRAPKIFFTGENIFNSDYYTPYNRFRKHYLKNINLSLGFSYTEHSKYLRFPLWILYIIPPDSNLESIRNILDKYNDRSFRLTTGRENFCSNISRLDNIGIRKTMIDLINPIEEVKCAGDFMKNTDDLQKKYGDDKIEYLKNFKFNICPENSDTPGYVTEKLFEAIISGCIPLYWGSNNVPESEIINQNSILFYDSKNPKALFDKVQLLWNDENAYKNFCAIKPFKDDAAEVIWELLNSLESKLRKVI